MLPPVLEIFVIWHPEDPDGQSIAEELVAHFRSVSFSGVVGGGVHVSLRSAGWHEEGQAPRPVYTHRTPAPSGMQPAEYIAIVPLMGIRMAEAVEKGGSWQDYFEGLIAEQQEEPERIQVLPYLLDRQATNQTRLGDLLGPYQMIATEDPARTGDTYKALRCRDLSQALAQMLFAAPGEQLTVFVSHTKRSSEGEGPDVEELVELVRSSIGRTRLDHFFDANDLQPGQDWENELRTNSARSAMLAIRTDLYASREWCQREIALAKCAGMPVVTLDAIASGEQRGSFLMDHVPRVPVKKGEETWSRADVMRALSVLTDECLKQAMWQRQQEITAKQSGTDISWWAPQAPEPLTLLHWIENSSVNDRNSEKDDAIRILHPDPPLGPEEHDMLSRLARMSKLEQDIDVMTPRILAARGG